MNEQCDGAIRKILEQQLYKEDFDEVYFFKVCEMSNGDYYMYCLIDSSKYEKLPSKDVK